MKLDWNLFTDDPHLAVNPDYFRLSVQAELPYEPYYFYETVLYESFESLMDTGLLTEFDGVSLTPGCSTCVWTTGWTALAYPLPGELFGSRVTVTVAVSQGGGGETAVLVDNIRFQ